MNAYTHPFPERPPLEPVAVPEYVRPVDLPLQQQIALVTLNRCELSGKIIDALFAKGNKRATYVDFSALVTLGYAWRPEGENFHRITDRGVYAAKDVATSFAKKLDIHYGTVTGGSRYDWTLRCSCGASWGLSLNQGHLSSQAGRAMRFHLKQVAALKEIVVVVAVPGAVS